MSAAEENESRMEVVEDDDDDDEDWIDLEAARVEEDELDATTNALQIDLDEEEAANKKRRKKMGLKVNFKRR